MSDHYLLSIVSVGLSLKDIKNTFKSLPFPLPVWIQYIIVAPNNVVKSLESDPLFEYCDFVVDNRLGVYSAMNLGIDVSKGSYLWFLNSGDFWNYTSFDDLFLILSNSYEKNTTFILGRSVIHELLFFPPIFSSSLINLFLKILMFFQVMPICHQNIITLRRNHPHFDTSYSYSADFNLLISSINLQSKTRLLPVNFSLSSPGGISDTYRLKVFLERLDSSLSNSSFLTFPVIFVSFFIRILYLALSNFIKSILLFLR